MDIAVMADIHGNYIALKRCVEEALERGIRTFFFLGDYVGEAASPQKTLGMLYELDRQYDCRFVKGNREDYQLEHRDNGGGGWQEGSSTTGALYYNYKRLTERDFDFFRGLPFACTVAFPGLPELMLCHGSPERVGEKMLPDCARTYELIEASLAPIILCGHTHEQKVIRRGERAALNAGSVGLPLSGSPDAQFLILHGEDGAWRWEMLSLPYDVDAAVNELRESGLCEEAPYWSVVTEHLLLTGSRPHSFILDRAMELCRAEQGKCVWPDIDEKYWAQAVKEILY